MKIILPTTPPVFISSVFMIVTIIGTRLGIETLGRFSELYFPWVILLFIIFVSSIAPQIEPKNLSPVLEAGMKPVLRGTYNAIYPFLDLAAFLMIFPFIHRKGKVLREFLAGTWIAGIILIITTLLCILVLGFEVTAIKRVPTYWLAKLINIGDFIQRFEVIVAFIWFVTMYFKLTVYFYALTLGTAQFWKLKDFHSLTLPFGVILVSLSLVLYPNIGFAYEKGKSHIPFSIVVTLVLPLVLIGVDKVKKMFQTDNHLI